MAGHTDTVFTPFARGVKGKKRNTGLLTLGKQWLSINKHVIPEMGNKPIDSIRPAYILEFFRKLEKRGVHAMSAKLRRALVEAFDIAAHTSQPGTWY